MTSPGEGAAGWGPERWAARAVLARVDQQGRATVGDVVELAGIGVPIYPLLTVALDRHQADAVRYVAEGRLTATQLRAACELWSVWGQPTDNQETT